MPTNEGLKQHLMADYERVQDELLAKRKPDDEIALSEIEQLVLEAREEMSEQMLAALTEVGEWEQPRCPWCGGRMHYKGRRSRQVVTLSGEVRLSSAYYYRPSCQTGFPPLHERWGLGHSPSSPGLWHRASATCQRGSDSSVPRSIALVTLVVDNYDEDESVRDAVTT